MLLSWSYSVQRVILINVYSDHWQRTILKWQCHEILTIFLLKRFDLGPIWTGENGFASFFVFAKIFDRKVQKSRVRVVNDNADKVFLRISSRKQKILLNRFCLFIWSTGGVFSCKKFRKSRNTVPSKISLFGPSRMINNVFCHIFKIFQIDIFMYSMQLFVRFVPIGFFFYI